MQQSYRRANTKDKEKQRRNDVYFVSSNKNKFAEIRSALSRYSITAGFMQDELEEIQSDKLESIAQHKALDAYSKHKMPVLVEDDALFVDSLNGFPGPYSSYVYKTIGNNGILDLLRNSKHEISQSHSRKSVKPKENANSRRAKFVSAIAFCDNNLLKTFTACMPGRISQEVAGTKWGFDPIFIPKGYDTTYSNIQRKNSISHRAIALDKFAKWWTQKNRRS